LVGAKFSPIGELARDIQHEPADKAPQVILIEPRYFDFFAALELLKHEGPLATGTKYPDLIGAPLTS
jgi:hypothetical protein